MLFARIATFLFAAFFLILAGSPSSIAQQRSQPRVFTNEDIASTPPAAPAPAAEAPAAEPASESAPAGDATAATQPPAMEQLPGPQGDLKLTQDFQDTLRRFHELFTARLNQEANPDRQERWRNLMNLTMRLMAENQQNISQIATEVETPSQ